MIRFDPRHKIASQGDAPSAGQDDGLVGHIVLDVGAAAPSLSTAEMIGIGFFCLILVLLLVAALGAISSRLAEIAQAIRDHADVLTEMGPGDPIDRPEPLDLGVVSERMV
jgi:hypothetical protein